MKKLEGKVAVITGGNSGIGLATAQRFVDWQGLNDRSNLSRYQNSWFEMKEQILNRKNDLIQNILTRKQERRIFNGLRIVL